VGVERSSIKPKGFKGAFFYYQSNVHTFNCRYRTDRRVEGLVAEGWVGGRWDGWVAGGMGGLQKLITDLG
jgi:hypothetical protein